MFKKPLSILVAVLLLASSVSIMALAAPGKTEATATACVSSGTSEPAETAEPAETTEPDETAEPAETSKPDETAKPEETAKAGDTEEPKSTENPADSAFIAQIKAMRQQIQVVRDLLKAEAKNDMKLRSDIRSLQGIVKADTQKIKEYTTQLKALTKQLADLNRQLKAALAGRKKDHDTAKIAELKASIQNVKDQIAALNAQYKPLLDQVKGNASGRRSLKPLRQELDPQYKQLKTLLTQAKTMYQDVNKLVIELKTAIQANDTTKTAELVAQITDKLNQIKANIDQRIAIRQQITKMLEDYKAKLEAGN